MRRVLAGNEPEARWPENISVRTLRGIDDAKAVHALLSLTYGQTGDALPAFGKWWESLSGDEEFDPELCFLALDQAGGLAGVAQCWTSAFLKDLAVRPNMRRRGLGEGLVRHCFAAFSARGASRLDLKVKLDNPTGAVRLYERAGMVRVAWEG
jgi:ribosomal protein S18 acetylase RimI-like enzyme